MRKTNFSKSSLSACNARPVHTDGPIAEIDRRSSGRRFRTRVSPDHPRRLSKSTQEGAAHAVAISKARLLRDDVDRMTINELKAEDWGFGGHIDWLRDYISALDEVGDYKAPT